MRYPHTMPLDDQKGLDYARAGLCADCAYARRIESSRRSTFYLCERSSTDTSFPKYPRLPILECSGYSPKQ